MDIVIAGCGDLGIETGLRFAAAGHRVVGLRRRAELVPAPLTGQGVDLRRSVPEIPRDTGVVVVAVAAGNRDVDEYRATYVDGLRNVLDGIDASGAAPRVIVVSSTAVYDVDDGSTVTEDTRRPVAPPPRTSWWRPRPCCATVPPEPCSPGCRGCTAPDGNA